MKKAELLISLFLMTGFFAFAQTGLSVTDSIKSGGITRKFIVYLPNIYNGTKAVPLIINMHGYGSNMGQQQGYGNFMPVSDTANFILVQPQGTKDSQNTPYWNANISSSGVNDIQFISNLIDSLKAQYNIDLNRVYSTGMSNGGFMSHTLACDLSQRIAAIASVTGVMFTTQYGNYGSACNPSRPVPVMQIHGTADGVVPYNGDQYMIGVDTVVKFWVKKNNCNATATFSNVPNTNTTDGCTAQHYYYGNGNSGSSVELYKITGGGHSWPGASVNINITNMDFNASVEIWRFFRGHSLGNLSSVKETFLAGNAVSFYPNPVSDYLSIITHKDIMFSISDIFGKEVITSTSQKTISVSHLPAGIYFLNFSCEGERFVKKIIKY